MKKKLRNGVLFSTAIATTLMIGGCSNNSGEDSVVDGDAKLTVKNNSVVEISDTLFGLFFEDINFALDGGLYAEKVVNRSFEFRSNLASSGSLQGYRPMQGATLEILREGGLNENNPSFAKLNTTEKGVGFINEGFLEGMYFEKDAEYRFSVYIKSDTYNDKIKIALTDNRGNEIGVGYIENITEDWSKQEVVIKASETVDSGNLNLTLENEGEVYLDMVSLFPVDTYKNRENGLRPDMVKMLEELNPAFLRFPGGCVIEGQNLGNAYNWKDTVGDISERKQNENLWWGTKNYPYYQSYGVGFYEYFLLCEDLGAKAIPVVNAGMSCQVRGGNQAPLSDMEPYVQDALDLVEFCRGDETTTWGKVRIDMGHPEPFEIEYIGIGNEQYGKEYFDRYDLFVEAFREKYPEIKLVSTSGIAPSGDMYEFAWDRINTLNEGEDKYANLVDEHYYCAPEWYLKNINRYDSYDRDGAGVFVGEYAARANTLKAALAEAAYMTGLEKNSDIVEMAAYAPLFGNITSSQWTPDLIWFNNAEVFGSVNYYVQKLYANNTGDYTLETNLENIETVGNTGMVGLGTWKTGAMYDDIKVVDNETGEVLFATDFEDGDISSFKGNGIGTFELVEDTDGNKVIAQKNAKFPINDEVGGSATYVGDASWTNYTYTLRAQKTLGNEGFLIPFGVRDNENFYRWNIGGWGNTKTCIEEAVGNGKDIVSDASSFRVETKRWYDIKIVVEPNKIYCYIDDELIHEVETAELATIHQTTSFDEETNEVIIKLVNNNETEEKINIDLKDFDLTGEATIEVMGNAELESRNTLKNPEALAPVKTDVEMTSKYEYTMPKNSFTVIRVKTK